MTPLEWWLIAAAVVVLTVARLCTALRRARADARRAWSLHAMAAERLAVMETERNEVLRTLRDRDCEDVYAPEACALTPPVIAGPDPLLGDADFAALEGWLAEQNPEGPR